MPPDPKDVETLTSPDPATEEPAPDEPIEGAEDLPEDVRNGDVTDD